MGGGHGHGPPYVVPDYTIYKVENCPELMKVKEKLAKKGLSDPWLRNEVWRYDRKNFPSPLQNTKLLFRGFWWGVGLCALTLAYERLTRKADDHAHH